MEKGLIFPIVCSNEGENSLPAKIFSAHCFVMTEMGEMGWGAERRVKRKEIYVYIELIHFVIQ